MSLLASLKSWFRKPEPDAAIELGPFDEALIILRRIEELADVVTLDERQHLAWRLGRTTQDVAYLPSRSAVQHHLRLAATRNRRAVPIA